MFTPLLRLLSSVCGASWFASVMLRSASDSVPSCWESASVSVWAGVSSSVAVLPDHDLLAVFLLHVLVDRQHADIGKTGFAAVRVAAAGAFIGVAFSACQNDVDMIVRQDESAGAGLRRNLRGDGAHAGRQDRGHEAGAFGIHELGLADRLAADEWIARDGPGQRFDGVRPIGLADEISSCCVSRP